MKRSGFTMIELIFVIVILGILASVAIPKIAATRDDAKVSKALTELATLKSDLSIYYTARGTYTAGSIGNETNVPLYTTLANGVCSNVAGAIAEGTTYYYCVQDGGTIKPVASVTPSAGGSLAFADVAVAGLPNTIKTTNQFTALMTTVNNGGTGVSY